MRKNVLRIDRMNALIWNTINCYSYTLQLIDFWNLFFHLIDFWNTPFHLIGFRIVIINYSIATCIELPLSYFIGVNLANTMMNALSPIRDANWKHSNYYFEDYLLQYHKHHFSKILSESWNKIFYIKKISNQHFWKNAWNRILFVNLLGFTKLIIQEWIGWSVKKEAAHKKIMF